MKVLPAGLVYLTVCVGVSEAQTVQTIMFYSPTCQHCHQVITQYLPVLFQNYGGQPSVATDLTVPEAERCLHLFRNAQLELLLIDASKPVGTELYLASNVNQNITPERTGVPRLVIGDVVLVGSLEIPEQTGDLVQQGLDQGGLAWPVVDGLAEAIASIPGVGTTVATEQQDSTEGAGGEVRDSIPTDPEPAVPADTAPPTAEAPDTIVPVRTDAIRSDSVRSTRADTAVELETEESGDQDTRDREVRDVADSLSAAPAANTDTAVQSPADSTTPGLQQEAADSVPGAPSVFDAVQTREPSMLENFGLDPVGNSFSVVVLLFMIASVLAVWLKPHLVPVDWGQGIGIPLLAVVGAIVASYLTYIEATGVTAVCGPVGDCNTVNQSEYARLFGVLPVGALGLAGYIAVVVAWSAAKFASEQVSQWARLSLLAMAVAGTLFSTYLTFLEPFVIGATCAWCLTSSVVMTLMMWLSAGSGRAAWKLIRGTHA
jgi:uncharacterized membrane protein